MMNCAYYQRGRLWIGILNVGNIFFSYHALSSCRGYNEQFCGYADISSIQHTNCAC